MGIYNMYGRQLQYHCNKILGSVHNGLSTKAEGLLTNVRATTHVQASEWNIIDTTHVRELSINPVQISCGEHGHLIEKNIFYST